MARVSLAQYGGLILFLIIIKGSISENSRSPFQYKECNLGKSLIDNSILWASKQYSDLTRLDNSTGVWNASVLNSMQFLIVDLGAVHIVTRVYTQGRQGSDEYVTEFTIEFSMDNTTWEEYTNEFGLTKIYKGNEDSNTVKENTFTYPVIAQYIKFRPLRWNKHISMRVDVIGCLYVSEAIQTGNNGYIVYDGTDQQSTQTETDLIMLRFRTTQENGILLYAAGNYTDFILIELRRGQLHLVIDLGSTRFVSGVTPVAGRSVLNDGRWHDVIFQRNRRDAKLTVDRRETEFKTKGFFFRFNSNGKVYLGGVDYNNKKGVSNTYYFNGCIDFVRLNGINITKNVKDRIPGYQTVGQVEFTCSLENATLLSFQTTSILNIPHVQETGDVRVTFQFRTFDKSARIFRHQMLNAYVQVGTDRNGFVYYKITDENDTIIEDVVQKIDVEGNIMEFTDGLWHTFDMYINRIMVNVTVDRNSRVTNKQLDVHVGTEFIFGAEWIYDSHGRSGGIKAGFKGCLRDIEIGSAPVDIANSPSHSLASTSSCDIKDKCFPNPCEHNGKCSQDGDIFYCDCGSTGYKGAVCHTSVHPLSCADSMHKDMHMKGLVKTTIDPDGSGPIYPFTVTCNIPPADFRSHVETWIAHNSMRLSTVDGYQAPNYFVRKVEYESDLAGLTEVIERSDNCEQEILWRCNNSRLMALTDLADPSISRTYGYWVGRTYQNMYSWGGSAPGTYKCACGVTEKGCVLNTTTCNCDSGEKQTEDGGLLTRKEFLPVLELHFGDTGTFSDDKIGQFRLGELRCVGENMFDNVITFRKTDATLEFETLIGGKAWDIWFQFKTTATDGVMIHDTDDTEDNFLQIRLTGGNTIQFSYNVGNGADTLEYRASNILNDDTWHTVHVEHNLKQAWLRVDNFPEVINNNTASLNLSLFSVFDTEPLEIPGLMELTKPLTVGATVDHRDGFVGCMRALRVNGVLIDMRGAVRKGKFTYGVQEGCVGKCSSNPCFNQGQCVEGYSHYTCNCTHTPFEGRMCSREVGVSMQGNYMIRYDNMSINEEGGFKFIRIGFITKRKQGILLQLREAENPLLPYISIEMNNAGGVKFFMDIGFERWELNTYIPGIDLTNGQAHEIIVWREESGKRLFMQVDSYDVAQGYLGEHLANQLTYSMSDMKLIFIGNNDTERSCCGFYGCIFRMEIDGTFPLKTAFQDPKPNFVTFAPEGRVHKETCEFEELTHAPDPVEERVYSPVCGNPVPPPSKDRGGKTLTDGDLLFSFSLLGIEFNSTEEGNITNTTEPLTMTCRVTAADISVIYYILIQQETSPGSGEFECLAMIESGGMQIPRLYKQLNTDKDYIVNGSLDRALTTYPYVSVSIDVQNLTASDAKDYVCEVAYKNSSTEVFEKVSTVSHIVADYTVCVVQQKLKTASSQDDKSSETKIGIAVGVIGGVIIIIAIVAAICVSKRRKTKTLVVQSRSAELSAFSSSKPDTE
ncbi:neurexin-4-like [Mercenaria mercenaria]|uniref:neurexin-4-like n=1 Tax=Mercenaria mercenaria TaxID=6596 RepID=UPI00234FA0DE|nr:neurexin-4-like [Mercenaria mercenaria]